jgi:hypothetical protein
LARAIDSDRLPAHIAIIMDGSGRWAKRRGQLRVAGHKADYQKRNRRFGGLGAPATLRDDNRLSEAVGIPAR